LLQSDEKSIAGNQGRQILVVDDEPIVCRAIKMLLAYDGHMVQTCSSGSEALALLEHRSFDVIFTDYAMPEMKGDELAAVIKQRLPNQSIVMITAHADALMASGNPLPGVDFLISKPFLMAELREAVARVLPGILNLNAVEFISAHRDSAGAHF
jgi:two-component system cell cycle response regulator CpdR